MVGVDEDRGDFVFVGLEAAGPVLDPADVVARLAGDGVCYACKMKASAEATSATCAESTWTERS